MKRAARGLIGGSLAVLLSSVMLHAQAGSTAKIAGVVKDTSGGGLPGADVTATQTDTGLKRTTVTDAKGSYTLPNLPVGPYRLDVNLPGFKSYVRTGVVLQVNDAPVINVDLSLGAVEETVSVQAASPLVETRNTGLGQVMENERIPALPLNGRNPVDLIALTGAAVQPDGAAGISSSRSMQGGKLISIAGGQSAGVAYLLDGATHNNPYDNANLPLPFPDALQEFKVETSALSAQNGMHSGAAVNAVTRSGTNQVHGDAFEFLRNHNFNATNPFAAKNADGTRKDDGLNRNQYGGVLGGPIRHDKLFFFAGYQGTNTRQTPSDNIAFIPTAQILAGDWTAFASPACNGGRTLALRAPFVNNAISPALYDKASLAIVGRLSTTTDPCGRTNYPSRTEVDEGQTVAKLDYQRSANHSLFGRYMATSFRQPPPFSLIDNVLTTTVGGRDNLAQSLTFGDNYILSTHAVNAFRFAFNRTAIHRTSQDFFSYPDVGVNTFSYMPHYLLLTITGGFSLGGGTESESTFRTNTYQFGDDLQIIKGDHQIAIGGSAAYWKSTSLANVRSPGTFNFDGSAVGAGLADFMVGRPNQFTASGPNNLFMTEWYVGLYAQDSWKANDRTTVNYGVRWEPYFPQQVTNGAIYNFSIDGFKAGQRTSVFTNAPPGFTYPGDPSFPNGFAGMNKRWTDVAPRVGIAWDPKGDGRMSLRSSYGVSYDFVNGQYHLNTAIAPPWGSDVRIQSPVGGFDNPFLGYPGGNPFPLPFDSNAGERAPANARFSPGANYLAVDPDIHPTTVQSYNVSLQRQIAGNWVASASYIGAYTTHLWNMKALHYGLTSVTSAAPNGVPTTCLPTASTFGTCMNSILQQRRVLSQIDPVNGAFIANLDAHDDSGWERYNGMLVSIERRGSRVSYSANYTVSKYLNASAFAQPAFGTLGTYARNSLYGPSRWQIDMVVARVVRFAKTQNVELRVEAFNITNNFIRNNPIQNLSSATFGQVLQAGDPRILQFGAKYVF